METHQILLSIAWCPAIPLLHCCCWPKCSKLLSDLLAAANFAAKLNFPTWNWPLNFGRISCCWLLFPLLLLTMLNGKLPKALFCPIAGVGVTLRDEEHGDWEWLLWWPPPPMAWSAAEEICPEFEENAVWMGGRASVRMAVGVSGFTAAGLWASCCCGRADTKFCCNLGKFPRFVFLCKSFVLRTLFPHPPPLLIIAHWNATKVELTD